MYATLGCKFLVFWSVGVWGWERRRIVGGGELFKELVCVCGRDVCGFDLERGGI